MQRLPHVSDHDDNGDHDDNHDHDHDGHDGHDGDHGHDHHDDGPDDDHGHVDTRILQRLPHVFVHDDDAGGDEDGVRSYDG